MLIVLTMLKFSVICTHLFCSLHW